MRPRFVLLISLSGTLLAAQGTTFQRPRTRIPEAEKEAIQTLRKGSRPRPVSPRGVLPAVELTRARIFESAKPSVVHVSSSTLARNLLTRDVFSVPAGMGTGFVWDEHGHVVTNHHVLLLESEVGTREATDVQVTLDGGATYKAQVIGRSLSHDIAVLRVFAPLDRFKPLPLGTSRNLRVGQDVLAIGNPFGLDQSLTAGIISALNRNVFTGSSLGARIRNAIQTDAPINPGNSGGPLLDSAGRLIGMNTSITTTSGSSAGIGFSIPVDTLNRVVPAIIARGQLERPELGFSVASIQNAALLGVQEGLVVEQVDPGSPADAAGLKGLRFQPGALPLLGDVIVGLKGMPLSESIQLFDELELLPPEEPVALDVLRDGVRTRVVIQPGKARPRAAAPVV